MPIERANQGFKDISMSFARNPLNNDLIGLKDNNAIARSLRNIVFTRPGEKFFNPNFGSRISESLFDNVNGSTALAVRDEIKRSIENYEPRAIFLNVEVIPDAVNLGYTINVTFGIKNNAQKEVFTQFLNTVRG